MTSSTAAVPASDPASAPANASQPLSEPAPPPPGRARAHDRPTLLPEGSWVHSQTNNVGARPEQNPATRFCSGSGPVAERRNAPRPSRMPRHRGQCRVRRGHQVNHFQGFRDLRSHRRRHDPRCGPPSKKPGIRLPPQNRRRGEFSELDSR